MNADSATQEILGFLATGRSIATFTGRDPAFDLARGYDVLVRVHSARVARGEGPIGRKIGFTNRNLWTEYGVREPIWGFVYDTTLVHAPDGRVAVDLGRLVEPRIEPEVVLHFRSTPPVTRDEAAILECIDWIAHGVEIVQTPFPGWKFKAADTVAVNALHGLLVVGVPVPVTSIANCVKRLRTFRLALEKGDTVAAEGGGANVLDSPLLAFAYLADLLVTLPQFPSVGAGEIVTTGTLTSALRIEPGETWKTTLSGIDLPGLTITFRGAERSSPGTSR